MAILPNELLAEICSYADIATLKNIRLADRTFSAFASEVLFEEIEFILLPESISNARKIIGHPKLRYHVTTIRYFGERLYPDMQDYELWKFHALHVSTDMVPARFKVCWYRVCRLILEQLSLIRNGAETDIFKLAIRQLPNLNNVEIRDTCWASLEGRHQNPYQSVSERILVPQETAFMDASAGFDPESSPHLSLLRALSSTQNRVKKLSLDDVPLATCSDLTNVTFYLHMQPLFPTISSNLRYLFLNCWTYGTFLPLVSAEDVVGSTLCKLLSLAPLLEELDLLPYQVFGDLDWNGHISEEERHTDATDIFSQLTWRNLRKLSVSNCLIGTEAFVGFIKRHSSTLVDLQLGNIKLTDSPIGAPGFIAATRTSKIDCPSAWEWAAKELAPVLDLEFGLFEKLTDDELASRIKQGVMNGIPVEWLVKSWRNELTMYLEYWQPNPRLQPYFPVYGQPRVIVYEEEDYEDGCG